MKSPETDEWPQELRTALIAHIIQHYKFIDPAGAFELS